MWPASRPPTTLYQPIRDPEQQAGENIQTSVGALYPQAPIPRQFLLNADNKIKQEQLLGGDSRIDQSLLLGGNVPIAEHLLLTPKKVDAVDAAKDEDDVDVDDADFEHLDYLEPGDDVPLTSRRSPSRRMPTIKVRTAIIAAVLLVLLISLVTAFFATGGTERLRGPGEYRK